MHGLPAGRCVGGLGLRPVMANAARAICSVMWSLRGDRAALITKVCERCVALVGTARRATFVGQAQSSLGAQFRALGPFVCASRARWTHGC